MPRRIPSLMETNLSDTYFYNDKDSSAVLLPEVVDLGIYAVLRPVFTRLRRSQKDSPRQILLDFSRVRELQNCGIAAFTRLNRYIKGCNIKLIMLNAPKEIAIQLTWRLPNALWLHTNLCHGKRDEYQETHPHSDLHRSDAVASNMVMKADRI